MVGPHQKLMYERKERARGLNEVFERRRFSGSGNCLSGIPLPLDSSLKTLSLGRSSPLPRGSPTAFIDVVLCHRANGNGCQLRSPAPKESIHRLTYVIANQGRGLS